MKGQLPALVQGYRTRIIDGNHLAATERRLKVLHRSKAGPLPGHSLVVLDPALMLATNMIPCEDGHAQERSLTNEILELTAARDLWVADRNNRSPEQKTAALKKHLLEKQPVSQVCEEFEVQPSVFYRWQAQLFENADKALEGKRPQSSVREKELEAKIAALEARVARKDAVIADISEEHVKLKKELGEL